jgi:hypothetical protein
MEEDFKWIMKVIESCETAFHFRSSDLLIELFIDKHGIQPGCSYVDELATHLQVKHASVIGTIPCMMDVLNS